MRVRVTSQMFQPCDPAMDAADQLLQEIESATNASTSNALSEENLLDGPPAKRPCHRSNASTAATQQQGWTLEEIPAAAPAICPTFHPIQTVTPTEEEETINWLEEYLK